MRGPIYAGIDPTERARRMARYRAAKKRAESPQLDFDFSETEEANARWQPGVYQLTTEAKANG